MFVHWNLDNVSPARYVWDAGGFPRVTGDRGPASSLLGPIRYSLRWDTRAGSRRSMTVQTSPTLPRSLARGPALMVQVTVSPLKRSPRAGVRHIADRPAGTTSPLFDRELQPRTTGTPAASVCQSPSLKAGAPELLLGSPPLRPWLKALLPCADHCSSVSPTTFDSCRHTSFTAYYSSFRLYRPAASVMGLRHGMRCSPWGGLRRSHSLKAGAARCILPGPPSVPAFLHLCGQRPPRR